MITDEFIEAHLRAMSKVVEGSDQVNPFALMDLDKQMAHIMFDFKDDEDKEKFAQFLYYVIRNNRITNFLLTFESWITKISDKEDVKEIMSVAPDKRPKTKECIFVVYADGKQEKSWIAEIKRIEDKRVLMPFNLQTCSSAEGRFGNIWKQAKAATN